MFLLSVRIASYRKPLFMLGSMLALIGLSCATACSYGSAPPITPTTIVSPPTAAAPQIGITIPVTTPTAGPVATVAATESAAPFVPFINYMADVELDLNTHIVSGTLTTTYRNVTAAPLSEIVFRIVPAETPDMFNLTAVSTDSLADSHTLTDSRLTIALHDPLAVNDSATIKISFTLKIPAMPPGGLKNGYLGYSDRQINLGDWLPAVAPNVNGDWLVPHAWPNIGETTVTESARYMVTLRLHGIEANKQIVAAPGAVEQLDSVTWRFTLDHGRNFALSISRDFVVRHVTTSGGITVELYSFGESVTHVFEFALDTAQDAISRYGQLFGPCPYQRIVLVEGDFPDGMEFSGLVFISATWFTTYPNKPESWLMLITVHELAHQWWYSSVGDDQSRTPFMDETFAVYSELLYVEQTYPGQDEWWWTFRVKAYQPQGYVDSTVYDFNAGRPYINAVYLRGALFLDEIRATIGDTAFMTWLRDYARTQADKIATPAALWGLLSADDYAKIAPIRARYLKIPDPLDNPAVTAAATSAAPLKAPPVATSPATSPAAHKS